MVHLMAHCFRHYRVLVELSLLFNWEYFWSSCLMWTTCRWRADDMRVRSQVRFHQRMTYVIWMSSTRCLHTCLSWPISCSTTPGVIHTSSEHHPQMHMSSAHHLHIICMLSAHTCHLNAICTSSADTYIICTVLMDPNFISCAKDTSY